MRLLITGGGTAGHVYPALAMLRAWETSAEAVPELLWVGSTDGMEQKIVTEHGIPYTGIAAGALRGKALLTMLANLGKLTGGLASALAAVRAFRPDVVLATGGYVSAPVGMAARLQGIPLLLFLPDIKPGLTIQFLSKIATRVAVSFEDSRAYLPAEKVVVTGYPVRPELLCPDRVAGRAYFGLQPDLPVLFLYGGSRGARTLNMGVAQALPELLEHCQFIHVCGSLDEATLQAQAANLPPELAQRYHLSAFLGDAIVHAFAAADLGVARAGASTLAEFPAAGIPAIVVPGAFSDQDINADYLVKRGAAVKLSNAEVEQGALPPAILNLLADKQRREQMAKAMHDLARPHAAQDLIGQITGLVRRKEQQ